MSSTVALVEAQRYDIDALVAAMRRAIECAGFDLQSCRGRRVLLKPNMLGAYPPAMGVTTHPAFVEAAVHLFQQAEATVGIGDSPNVVLPPADVWETTGMNAVCRRTGAEALSFESGGSVEREGLRIARAPLDADLLVNLPKLKTHALTVLTAAVKNCFGCVAGMQKARHHREHAERTDFAELLVRIADVVNPELTLVDGVVAMEGDGPSGGELVDLGVILAGTDVHAVDAAIAHLVGCPEEGVDTLAAAIRRGEWRSKALALVGDPIEALAPKSFSLPATVVRGSRDWWIARFVLGRIWSGVSAQPRVAPARCRRCGLCAQSCPVDVISGGTGAEPAYIDEAGCIQCFCCHEICPHRAIDLQPSWTIRLWRALLRRRMKGRGGKK